MSKPLTKRQITVLSIMAGKAYKCIQSQGCPLPSLVDWRHDEVWAATGVTESLTKATQEHYVPIYNRLATYLGTSSIKDRTWSEMDTALHNLREAMMRYETSPDYLAEIVRDQLHLPCTGSGCVPGIAALRCRGACPAPDVYYHQPGSGGCPQTSLRDWPGYLRAAC